MRTKVRRYIMVFTILLTLLGISLSGNGTSFAQQKGGAIKPIPGAYKNPAPLMSCGPDFSDVPVGSTFYNAVEFVYCNGIIPAPYGDGTFRPNDNFYASGDYRKGYVAKTVVVATSHSHGSTCTGSYSFYEDSLTDGLCQYVEAIASSFTVFGTYPGAQKDGYLCQPHSYDPFPCSVSGGRPFFDHLQTQSRDFDLKTYMNVAGYSLTGSIPQQFADVPSGSFGYDQISIARYSGLINGYACGGTGEPCVAPGNLPYYRPTKPITRAQFAQIIYNRQPVLPTYP